MFVSQRSVDALYLAVGQQQKTKTTWYFLCKMFASTNKMEENVIWSSFKKTFILFNFTFFENYITCFSTQYSHIVYTMIVMLVLVVRMVLSSVKTLKI